MKVSICLLTIDRYYMTKYVVDNLLKTARSSGAEIELLILDNGSEDKRVIEYGATKANVHIAEKNNIGVAAGFNKLLRISTGEYIVLAGNDILLNEGWLTDLLWYHKHVARAGVSAIHCVQDKGKYSPLVAQHQTGEDYEKFINVWVPENNCVYGIWLFHRSLIEKIGGFDSKLGLYGCEDSQYCFRAMSTGFKNYYIPGQYCVHLGEDFNQDSAYRKMKNAALAESTKHAHRSIDIMRKLKQYSIPL